MMRKPGVKTQTVKVSLGDTACQGCSVLHESLFLKHPNLPSLPKLMKTEQHFIKIYNTLIFYFKRFIYVKFGGGGQERIMKYMY